MTSLSTLQKEVEMIRNHVKPDRDIAVIFSFGSSDEPHGRYGHRKLYVYTGKAEPVDESQEIEMLQEHYERLPKHCKKRGGPWPTFEEFLKSRECTCGKTHPYVDPEYHQKNKWRIFLKRMKNPIKLDLVLL